jgi:arylsulfatase
VQYYEMLSHRGIYSNGWKAVTRHEPRTPFDEREWELYHVDQDFSECHNLAKENPKKLRELIDLWWAEAGKYGVLPLIDFGTLNRQEMARVVFRPGTTHANLSYRFYPPISHIPNAASPMLGLPSWIMSAKINRTSENDEGVLLATGTQNSGLSWYIKDNHVVFDYNYFADHHVIRSDRPLPTGDFTTEIKYVKKKKESTITLSIDGQEAGKTTMPFILNILSTTGMDVGRDILSAVSPEYKVPFEFTGDIKRIDIALPMFKSKKEIREFLETKKRVESSRD